jgi:predicted ATP-grasp superfamily ATP-dependent carboligase
VTDVSRHRPRVLILDGFWPKTVAAVRSLGRRGAFVAVGERTLLAPAMFSRYCSRRFVHPPPAERPFEFLEALERELSRGGYDVLLPIEFSTQVLVTRHRERFSRLTRIPFADAELALRVQDKGELAAHAARAGFRCPATFLPDGPGEAAKIAARLPYPVLVKPRLSSGGRGIERAQAAAELPAAYARVHARYPRPIVQEVLPPGGESLGVGALMNFSSEPRASFAYRRLREYPLSGGPSTLRESIGNDELRETAVRLLASLSWTGVAMVEFKIDPRDGRPAILEVNPRFWGSLNLAILSGVDFPYLLYRLAMEGDLPPLTGYREGVRSRALLPGELLHFAKNPDRFRLAPGLFDFSIPDDIVSFHDPLPALGRVSSLLAAVRDKELRELTFR